MTFADLTRRDALLLGLAGAARLAHAPVFPPPAQLMFDFAIAGGWHHGLAEAMPLLSMGQVLDVKAEFDNPHDARAVAVHMGSGPFAELRLGYLPHAANPVVAALLERGAKFQALVAGVLRGMPEAELAFTSYSDGDPRLRLVRVG